MVGADGFTGAAGEAAVHVQGKARIHRNTSAGNTADQGDTSTRRIGFRQGYAVGWAMRQTQAAGNAAVGFGEQRSGRKIGWEISWLRDHLRCKKLEANFAGTVGTGRVYPLKDEKGRGVAASFQNENPASYVTVSGQFIQSLQRETALDERDEPVYHSNGRLSCFPHIFSIIIL